MLLVAKSYDRHRDSMTQYYEADSTRLRKPISEVFDQFRDRASEKPENAGSEPARVRHAGNDGLYWKQLSLQSGAQLGFVEGYLYCHEKLAHDTGGVFSTTSDEYRALVTQWYRNDDGAAGLAVAPGSESS